MVEEATDKTFDTIIKSGPVLISLSANWCGPCRKLAPTIDELAEEYEGKVKIAKLDVDNHPDAPAKYKVTSIPTLLFFKDGKLVQQFVGIKSKAEIKGILDTLA